MGIDLSDRELGGPGSKCLQHATVPLILHHVLEI